MYVCVNIFSLGRCGGGKTRPGRIYNATVEYCKPTYLLVGGRFLGEQTSGDEQAVGRSRRENRSAASGRYFPPVACVGAVVSEFPALVLRVSVRCCVVPVEGALSQR